MNEETPAGSTPPAEAGDIGTTPGQSNQSGTPNDPQAFQADYTKKYQELSENRKALETEKATLAQERAILASQRNQAPRQDPGYTQVNPQQALVDQFGYEGAKAILQASQTSTQQIAQSQFDLLYNMEVQMGKTKYTEAEWDKHNYVDPNTGQQRNKIMDFRLATNPITGQTLTLDQAWNAANPTDTKSLEQKIRDAVYAEMNGKSNTTPASGPTSVPNSTGKGHANSIEQAFDQAASETGWNR